MYVLDTDVVSELRTPERADPHVAAWAARTPLVLHFISSVTLYELEVGILLMERRDRAQGAVLRAWMDLRYCPASRGGSCRSIPLSRGALRRCTYRTQDPNATPSSPRRRWCTQ